MSRSTIASSENRSSAIVSASRRVYDPVVAEHPCQQSRDRAPTRHRPSRSAAVPIPVQHRGSASCCRWRTQRPHRSSEKGQRQLGLPANSGVLVRDVLSCSHLSMHKVKLEAAAERRLWSSPPPWRVNTQGANSRLPEYLTASASPLPFAGDLTPRPGSTAPITTGASPSADSAAIS